MAAQSLSLFNDSIHHLLGMENSSDHFQTAPDENQQQAAMIHYPRGVLYFAAACAILFVAVGVAGNLLTMVALARSRKLRSHATTAFVLSLAASDLLFCLFNLPLTASRYIHESWILGDTLCQLFPFFFYGNVAASLFSMVLITINRYILIASPSWYDKIYRKHFIALMIIGAWSFSFGMMMPPLAGIWGELGLNPSTFSCTILPRNGKSPKKFFFIFGFIIPCLTIIISYTCIFIKVRQSRRNVLAHSPSANSGSRMNKNSIQGNGNAGEGTSNIKAQIAKGSEKHQRREDLRLTRMMLIIFCCFLLCFLPLMVVNVADDEKNTKVPVIHVLASILAWASSVINPFIYAFSNRQYRSAYRQLICGSSSARMASATQSRSSGRTFLTDILHYTAHGEKVKVIRTVATPTDDSVAHHI